MRRWFFTSIALASFTLLVIVAFMWIKSFWVTEMAKLETETGHRNWFVLVHRGSLVIECRTNRRWDEFIRYAPKFEVTSHFDTSVLDMYPVIAESQWHFLGMSQYTLPTNRFYLSIVAFVLPFGLLAAALSLVPAWWCVAMFRRQRALRRAATGHCAKCGYDLRPSSSTSCPECGTARYALK